MEIKITEKELKGTRPDDSSLGFGTIFTDHMFNMDYSPDKGWHNPRIEPFQNLSMSPATMTLHYGQSIFEGLKAYKNTNGEIQLFRARDNFIRFNRSAKGLCIPELDIDDAMEALKTLLRLEKDWIPETPGTSLYIRPTIIATDPFLGVRASHTYRFFIILSPVGAYYSGGFSPVKIWISKEHVRAVRGGVGEYKTAGNYAASLYASEKAKKEGYAQVLWLDGVELKYIEEVGAMNIFFVINDELATPSLNGSILPGITRDSVIKLGKKWGMKVSERKIAMDEVIEASKNGSLKEVFGSGTAAVISPVGEIRYGDEKIQIGDGKAGDIAVKFNSAITDIQYGKAEDSENWIEKV
ncbi:Branched-chain-amino-acid aminotransferase 2 [Desulfamplus magnetovallimortis]|uniref:Branched-chain-amino-acid aminotransferase n=1 Tax=Desulfamplus magnetovallimortis TaxID=1246637 RepID=A0A1W1HIP3_9BACT|nr:branched-chain amino acid aminotransferase [Desulfamplus magnetovallimortis]SLM32310.1 Branched-chain-amino-acid aminotransferase 2 [Desulfamplus magnetovallimortis]